VISERLSKLTATEKGTVREKRVGKGVFFQTQIECALDGWPDWDYELERKFNCFKKEKRAPYSLKLATPGLQWVGRWPRISS